MLSVIKSTVVNIHCISSTCTITAPRWKTKEKNIIKDGNNELFIRVITKLPNSEQSYRGKVKTHNYINRQISQQPENCENRNDPDLVHVRQPLFAIKL